MASFTYKLSLAFCVHASVTSGKVKNKKREQSFVLMRNVDKKGKSKKDPQTHKSLTLGSKSSSYVFFFFGGCVLIWF